MNVKTDAKASATSSKTPKIIMTEKHRSDIDNILKPLCVALAKAMIEKHQSDIDNSLKPFCAALTRAFNDLNVSPDCVLPDSRGTLLTSDVDPHPDPHADK